MLRLVLKSIDLSRTLALAGATSLAVVTAMAAPPLAGADRAHAQSALVGAKVKDAKGQVVGQIERVIAGPDGKPRQVLVRVGRVLRTLPTDALTPAGGDYVSVLNRAELEALPPSEG